MRFISAAGLVLAGLVLAACQTNDLKQPPVPLGNFALGVNVAITDKMQVPGISRQVTPEVMDAAITSAIEARFGEARYQGAKLFNIGVFVDGYLLAPPGIPIVLSPSSVMIVTLNVFDDATGKKLNPGGTQMTVVEKGSADTLIGSGLTQTKEKQLETLAYNVAKRIEIFLLENHQWLGMTKEQADAALAQANGTAPPPVDAASLAAKTPPAAAATAASVAN
ncbi:MAG: hypothetical protein U5N55_07750 [Cypionkella sp.]|nr:hypothetical protein [Cypionkella sp.]